MNRTLLSRPIAVTMCVIALVVLGILSLQKIPVSLMPDINSFAITGCQRKETMLNEGDIVITSGNLNLADGTEVKTN